MSRSDGTWWKRPASKQNPSLLVTHPFQTKFMRHQVFQEVTATSLPGAAPSAGCPYLAFGLPSALCSGSDKFLQNRFECRFRRPTLTLSTRVFRSSDFRSLGSGETALRLAMSKRNVEVVDLLVNNPDIRLNEGRWLHV